MRIFGSGCLALLLVACASTPPLEPAAPHQAAPAYEIINLYDDFGRDRPGVQFDFGFAALVRYGDKSILFDTGSQAAVLERNVAALGIDLKEVDIAILSHQHPDHHGGFAYLLEVNPDVKIYAAGDPFLGGPIAFDPLGPDPDVEQRLPAELRYRPRSGGGHGILTSGLFGKADVTYVTSHMEIAPGANLVFTRSKQIGYFNAYPPNQEKPRHLGLAEISLSLQTAAGEVLVVGCSHSTVETIIEVTRGHIQRPIDLVMGGYHLIPYDAATISALAARMRDEHGVARVAPAHCTGHLGFEAFQRAYAERFLLAGLGERIAFAAPGR